MLGCSLRLCWLLLGIRLAVTTAQSLNGLQSRIFFLPSACLPVSTTSEPVKIVSLCVSIMWECMEECVCKTDWATESTYRENLTTFQHPECHCPYGYKLSASPVSLPGMFVLEGHLCLRQTVTLAWGFKQCWRPHNWLPFSKN